MQISRRLRKLILVFLGFLIILFGKLVDGWVGRWKRTASAKQTEGLRTFSLGRGEHTSAGEFLLFFHTYSLQEIS